MTIMQMELLFVEKNTGFNALGLFSQVFLRCESRYPKIHNTEDQGLIKFDNSENVSEDDDEMDTFAKSQVEIMKSMGLPLSFGKQQPKSVKGKNKKKKKAKPKLTSTCAHAPVDSTRILNAYEVNTKDYKSQSAQSTINVCLKTGLGSTLSWAKYMYFPYYSLQNVLCCEAVSANVRQFLHREGHLPPLKLRLIPDIDICLNSYEKLCDSFHYQQRAMNLCFTDWESRTFFINSVCVKQSMPVPNTEEISELISSAFLHEQLNLSVNRSFLTEDEFNKFWSEHGMPLVLKSWTLKYAEYMLDNSTYDNGSDVPDSNPKVSNELTKEVESIGLEHRVNDDYTNLWQDLWNQHWIATMDEERDRFFKHNIKYCGNENNEDLKETQQKSPNSTTQTNNEIPIVQNRTEIKEKLDSPSHDEDDEPPEEIFYKKKRGHEDDVEENADFSVQFKKAGFAVETSVDNLPVPVKLVNFSKLKEVRDCQKSSHLFLEQDSEFIRDSYITESIDFINPDMSLSLNSKQKNKKKKKLHLPDEMILQPELKKYWAQRYRLFSKFDQGIKLDAESWYSVTPERISKHIARRCQTDIIVDAFCGAGGNTIQFALTCQHVLAIDIDPKKIELARHNATVYGVSNRIEFVVGDFMQLGKHLKADVVFVSMPWGGPEYLGKEIYDLNNTTPNCFEIMEICQKMTRNVVLFVPRNTNSNQLIKMAGQGNKVEIEQNILDKKLKTITAYYGNLVNNK